MPELRECLVESNVISDPGISTLPAIFAPLTLANHLRQALPNEYRTLRHLYFQILKHHPGSRCTFEMAMETANGWRLVIGKVYAVDRPDVYQIMEEIQRAGFGSQDEFSIPKPLAYLHGLRLLLQERVRGPLAKQVFLAGSERDRTKAVARCARWLAKFHAVGPRSGEVSKPIGQLHSIARWSRTIAKLGQPLSDMAERLSRRLEEEAAEPRGIARCAGHGSFNCNQIILTEDRTTVFDWDSYDVADPCRDVARFLVALQRLAFKYLGSIRALDGIAEVFLKTYQALSPFKVAENLPWYRALACLKLSFYEADRSVCTLRDGIEALLSEGGACPGKIRRRQHDGKIGRPSG